MTNEQLRRLVLVVGLVALVVALLSLFNAVSFAVVWPYALLVLAVVAIALVW